MEKGGLSKETLKRVLKHIRIFFISDLALNFQTSNIFFNHAIFNGKCVGYPKEF